MADHTKEEVLALAERLDLGGGDWLDPAEERMAATALRAYAEAMSAVPAGWRLVPEEPTEEMLDDADRAIALPEDYIRKAYSAMLAAAPPLPAREIGEANDG